MLPLRSNWISMNFPKREELSLRSVLALPNASSNGVDCSTFVAIYVWCVCVCVCVPVNITRQLREWATTQ